eukprot:643551-Hanusia_phi.AAC.1
MASTPRWVREGEDGDGWERLDVRQDRSAGSEGIREERRRCMEPGEERRGGGADRLALRSSRSRT